VVRLLFSVFCLLFSVPCLLSGCGGASRSLLGDFYVTNVASAQSEAKHVISDALADSDPVAKVNAIEVVGTTGRVDFMRRVQRLLRDQSVPVRFAASLAVGDLQYAPAQRSLRPLLQDPDANVIVAASYAMGRLGSPEYYQVVRKAAQSKIGDRSALKLLKSVQEDEDSTDKVRFQVLQARARLGDEEVLRRLWALVYSAYADDRVLAIQAIGALGTSRARDILATKLDDVVLEVRLAAAGQLGKLGDKSGQAEVLDVFEKNLTSGMDKQASERVNVLAALAIGEIRTAALTKYLPQLLKNESKYVRIAAAKAVFQCNMR
jgi:HEAT repeat protein